LWWNDGRGGVQPRPCRHFITIYV